MSATGENELIHRAPVRAICLLLVGLCAGIAAAETRPAATRPATNDDGGRSFEADLAALTASPHRLSGTKPARQAADYIRKRLRGMGLEPLEMSFPTWQTEVERCELVVDGKSVPLLPARPNVTIPPVTPEGGLTGPLLYAGSGELEAYGEREVEGAIVALDYDCGDEWLRAFALGAKAVIFLADGTVPPDPKHVPAPANLVRLYAPAEALAELDLRRDRERATVHSKVTWRRTTGRNVVARVPGSDPSFAPGRVVDEAFVLAANYDSFGEVPRRSPAARSAANVAGLLQTAERFAANPPKRDTILLFHDTKARYHAGMRRFYDALLMPDEIDSRLRDQHATEYAERGVMRRLVEPGAEPPLKVKQTVRRGAIDTLKQEVDMIRRRIKEKRKAVNIAAGEATGDRKEELEARSERIDRNLYDWATIRRLLDRQSVAEAPTTVLESLREAAEAWRKEARDDPTVESPDEKHARLLEKLDRLGRQAAKIFRDRREELELQKRMDRERRALRQRFGGQYIAMHLDYNLSDGGSRWGPVVRGSLQDAIGGAATGGDAPGYYTRLLQAFQRAASDVPPAMRPAPAPLEDPQAGARFAPGRFAASGMVAGSYQIHNVSLMTGYDARPREGHPADTRAKLATPVVKRQAAAVTETLRALSNTPGAGLNRQFRNRAGRNYPRWSEGQAAGFYAGIKMTGALQEDYPTRGAVLAVWPGTTHMPIKRLEEIDVVPGFDPFILTPAGNTGRFAVVGVQQGRFGQMGVLGAKFDENGRPNFVTAEGEAASLSWGPSGRVNLFPATGHHVLFPLMSKTQNVNLQVLKAHGNASFRPRARLLGSLGGVGFFYTFRHGLTERIKMFAQEGPVVLRIDEQHPIGRGVPMKDFRVTPPPTLEWTSEDLWRINEMRLARLRNRVSKPDLERIHAKARQLRKRGEQAEDLHRQQAAYAQSTLLSRRVYEPVRATLQDLIYAVIFLLLLTIPFAFALERLLICGSSIWTRIGGFALLFLLTFLVLYLSHPAFAIAATPMLILLAFVMILLTSMVIYLILRRFRAELHTLHGQSAARHEVATSGTGTLLAAVGMGMSTMRRRPLRTTLTAVTAIMLTFTVLCFASLTNRMGVKSAYEGAVPASATGSLLIRSLNYRELREDVVTTLEGAVGDEAAIEGRWWRVREDSDEAPFPVTGPERGQSSLVQGVMGLDPDVLPHWGAMVEALGAGTADEKSEALRSRGVFLPPILQRQLDLEPGEKISLAGREAVFAGALDAAAVRAMRGLDGSSALPVDFQALASGKRFKSAEEQEATSQESLIQKSFQRLGPNEIAIASPELVRELGGKLYGVRLRTSENRDPLEIGRDLARQLEATVWARGPDGVQRMVFGTITEVRGTFALVVPVVLGGLIIFGTLLGSITDRAREIYTFSALGLSPAHVGFLFFAEAGVYAVVGGMGGQLLAQGVSMGAGQLAQAGLIEAPSINYSSTNALFAVAVVMATVLVSAVYPAMKAGNSANPGVQRRWQMPAPEGDVLTMTFPFTVSAYDITGVISFLAEHFRTHDDAGIGAFAASDVRIHRDESGRLGLSAALALAPFDLGVTQHFTLTAVQSEIPGVDEVRIRALRHSGTRSDWYRGNRSFVQDLRRQFLLWRTLSTDAIEAYRMRTFEELGEREAQAAAGGDESTEAPS